MARVSPAKTAAKPAAAPASPPAPSASHPALKVVGPARGRRRAGREFGAEPVLIPLAALTDAERAAIETDPALLVQLVQAG